MHVQHGITSGYMSIITDARAMRAFWAYPQDGMTYPGVVLIHAGWGLTAHIRTQARRLAEVGYYVIAPDLFNGQTAQTPEQAAELYQQLGHLAGPRVGAALRALATHHHCNGRIGLLGWEAGGELAYQVAAHTATHHYDVTAAVIFYARPDNYLALLATAEVPILAFYGDADPATPASMIDQLRTALTQAPVKGEVIVYPGVSSGFFNETLNTYQAGAAADARKRMLAFLATHLDTPADQPATKNSGTMNE